MNRSTRTVWSLAVLAVFATGLGAQGPKPQASFPVGKENTLFTAVTPDGKTLVTLSDDGTTALLWDLASGKQRKAFKGLKPPASTAVLSNDGKRLATPMFPRKKGVERPATGGVVKVWDAASGKEVAELKGVAAALLYVEFSPDGKYLAGGEKDGRVRLWDAATGEVKAELKGPAKELIAVGFSADGKTLAVGDAFEPGEIRLWDWAAGKPRKVLKGHPDGVLTVEFTQDGQKLLSAGLDGTVRLWEVATGKEKVLYKGGKEAAPWATISPSGRTAAWTSGRSPEAKDKGKKPDAVTVYNLVTGKELASLKHAETVLFATFTAGGNFLVTVGQDGNVQVWDVAALREKKK
jgi:WD40 repeat protein